MAAQARFEIPESFSLHAITPSHIPPENVLISDAQAILEVSASWQAGKVHQNIKTFIHRESEGDQKSSNAWHCTVTEIQKDEISFSKLWSKLGKNKVRHQKSYVAGLAKVARVKYISESQSIWTMLATYPPPLSPRVFAVYQASWLFEHSHKRRGIVVTLPVDLSSKDTQDLTEVEEKGVRGRFVSVEHIHELDGDIIEWRRLARVDPGGLIPKFWVQRQVPNRMIEASLVNFLWLKGLKREDKSGDSGEESDQLTDPHRGRLPLQEFQDRQGNRPSSGQEIQETTEYASTPQGASSLNSS
ncbi:hypothetical protein BDZ97DRAFT_716377 [Flammula alnicola]|nr:hypothetical protein BDZ97DRAFT_716377 [Flammula alnicola]